MESGLDERIMALKKDKDSPDMENLIREYEPFIIKTLSEMKKSYVDKKNDDEYSIGLMAFHEAIERYELSRGHFLPYAKLVMRSKIKNYWQKEKGMAFVDLEEIEDMPAREEGHEAAYDLKEEILRFQEDLKMFGLDFEFLAAHSPKHRDTRCKAIEIGRKSSGDKEITDTLYRKLKLPVTLIANRLKVTVKIIKKSKYLILAVILVCVKGYDGINEWIQTDEKD